MTTGPAIAPRRLPSDIVFPVTQLVIPTATTRDSESPLSLSAGQDEGLSPSARLDSEQVREGGVTKRYESRPEVEGHIDSSSRRPKRVLEPNRRVGGVENLDDDVSKSLAWESRTVSSCIL